MEGAVRCAAEGGGRARRGRPRLRASRPARGPGAPPAQGVHFAGACSQLQSLFNKKSAPRPSSLVSTPLDCCRSAISCTCSLFMPTFRQLQTRWRWCQKVNRQNTTPLNPKTLYQQTCSCELQNESFIRRHQNAQRNTRRRAPTLALPSPALHRGGASPCLTSSRCGGSLLTAVRCPST